MRKKKLKVSLRDEFKWNICGNVIKCEILKMDQPTCKIDRRKTVFHFETSRQAIPFTDEEQKDIYLTSLADMIGKGEIFFFTRIKSKGD